MREPGEGDVHRTEFLALPAVDAGIGDVGKPSHVEHRVWRYFPGFDTVLLALEFLGNREADRAVLNA